MRVFLTEVFAGVALDFGRGKQWFIVVIASFVLLLIWLESSTFVGRVSPDLPSSVLRVCWGFSRGFVHVIPVPPAGFLRLVLVRRVTACRTEREKFGWRGDRGLFRESEESVQLALGDIGCLGGVGFAPFGSALGAGCRSWGAGRTGVPDGWPVLILRVEIAVGRFGNVVRFAGGLGSRCGDGEGVVGGVHDRCWLRDGDFTIAIQSN